MWRVGLVLGAVAVLIVVLGLRSGGNPRIHDDGEGLLSATSTSGGQGLNAPHGRSRWYGTFGSFLLCVTEPETRADVTGIRYRADIKPISVTFLMRRVPAVERRRKGLTWLPIGSSLGKWPDFTFGRPGGSLGPVKGVIDRSCASDDDEGYTELLVQIEAGPAGARIKRLYVDYTVDGEPPRTLRIRWQMVMCGTRTREVCS